MADILCDGLRPCIRSAKWRYDQSAHLFVADPKDLHHLHVFAGAIGLKRAWFQEQSSMPHYDLSPNKWSQAVGQGARIVGLHEFIGCMRAWRTAASGEGEGR